MRVGFGLQEPRLNPAKTVRGNLEGALAPIQALIDRCDKVPGVATGDQRLAFASWTVEARFRFRFGTGGRRGELVESSLATGDESYLVRRAFGAAAGSDTNCAIGLRVGVKSGRRYLHPFAKWFNTADTAPERLATRTTQVVNLELVERPVVPPHRPLRRHHARPPPVSRR